jgi:acetoin utilization protein AcuB
VGIISDRDLLRQVPELTATTSLNQATHRKLADLMTRRVVSAAPTTNIRDIARLMLDERIHAVPILDAHRRLVGMLTTHDLLSGIANHGPLELWT